MDKIIFVIEIEHIHKRISTIMRHMELTDKQKLEIKHLSLRIAKLSLMLYKQI